MFEKYPMIFAQNPLDRAGHYRVDQAWLKARLKDPSSRQLPVYDLKPYLLPAQGNDPPCLGWIRPGLIEASWDGPGAVIFLGMDGDRAHFAVEMRVNADPTLNGGVLDGFGGSFKDLRGSVMSGELAGGEAAIMAQARAMIEWHRRHPFCSQCGKATEVIEGGYKRICGHCKAEHFPRTDPVVIMLTHREGRALLGRAKTFPGRMFSALAGFVEPGETIEEAVAREIMEEVGVKVGKVDYFATQPWPFPMSLMIGCLAEGISEDIIIDDTEIAEARWFSREELALALKGETKDFFVPPAMAIAHHLIRAFVEGHK